MLHTLTEEVCRQAIREQLVCYCVLRGADCPLADDQLDARCERELRAAFGLAVDFTAEAAIPKLLELGLARRLGPGGLLAAEPLQAALCRLDARWDMVFQFSGAGPTEGDAGRGRQGDSRHSRKVSRDMRWKLVTDHEPRQEHGATAAEAETNVVSADAAAVRPAGDSSTRTCRVAEAVASWSSDGDGASSSSSDGCPWVILRTPLVPSPRRGSPPRSSTAALRLRSQLRSPTRRQTPVQAASQAAH